MLKIIKTLLIFVIIGLVIKMSYESPKFKETRKLAEQGIPEAQFNLGLMYENGDGVWQDKILAKEWYQSACNRGYQKACITLVLLDNTTLFPEFKKYMETLYKTPAKGVGETMP